MKTNPKSGVVNRKQVCCRLGDIQELFWQHGSMDGQTPLKISSGAECQLDGLTSLSHPEHVDALVQLGGLWGGKFKRFD